MVVSHSAVLIFIVIIAIAVSSSVGYDENNIQVYHDFPCLSIGGLCFLSTECPEDKQVPMKGMCPFQVDGIECCYSLPISKTQCHKRGGNCIQREERCHENLTFLRATGCGVDEKCCILV